MAMVSFGVHNVEFMENNTEAHTVVVALFAVTVLGIDAYLASIFLPDMHRESTKLHPRVEFN